MGGTAKIPPSDMEAEQSVLGAIMLYQDGLTKIATRAVRDWFYQEKHRIIFDAILELRISGEPIDVVTVSDKLSKQDKLQGIGGNFYITQLAEAVPYPRNIEHYAKIIEDKFVLRTIDEISYESSKDVYLPDANPDEVLQTAIQRLEVLKQQKSLDMRNMKSVVDSSYIQLKANIADDNTSGILSFRSNLDKVLAKFKPGRVSILAGDSSAGKSIFAQEQAYLWAKRGVHVMVASREMAGEEIVNRWMSLITHREQIGNIPYVNLERGDALAANAIKTGVIAKAQDILKRLPIYILDETQCSTMTPMDIRSAFAKCITRNKSARWIGIIDYIQILDADQRRGESRENVVARISSEILSMSKILQIPIIALSQLNKDTRYRTDKGRPTLDSIRESSRLVQDAYHVMCLYHNKEKIKNESGEETDRELLVLKNRGGASHRILQYTYRKEYGTFMTEDEASRVPYLVPSDSVEPEATNGIKTEAPF